MSTPANADLVAEALLRYFRDPVQYRDAMLHENEVTGNLDLVVRLALGRPVEFSSPGLARAGVAQELGRAAVFFFQQILFRDGASHYQVLGLTPNASPEAIRENRRLLIQVVHPDRHNTPVAWPESVAARVNRAYSVLRNADTRAAYDQQEADARGKLESGARTASAFPTSAGGVVRPLRRVPVSVLPEWLTDGLGGYVREHPAFTIFASLISLCVLVIGGALWSEREVTLTRDLAKAATAPGPAPGARVSTRQPKDGVRVPPILQEAREVSGARMPVVGTAQSGAMPARGALGTPVIAGSTQPLLATSGSARAPSPALVAQVAIESRIANRGAEKSVAVIVQPLAVSRTTNSAEAVASSPHRPVLQGEPVAVASSPHRSMSQSEPVAVASSPHRSASQGEPVAVAAPAPPTITQAVPTPKQATPAAITETAMATPAAPSVQAVATPKQTAPAAMTEKVIATPAAFPVQAVAPPPAAPVVQTVAAVGVAAARSGAAPISAEPLPEAHSQAPSAAEVEALIAAFISYYEAGRLDAFAALFDIDARTNEFRGRAAIRTEYNELFQRSSWRRMNLQQLRWRPVGERTEANGEIALKIGWRDGREVEQRIAVEMELVRRGSRTVIARLSQQVRNNPN